MFEARQRFLFALLISIAFQAAAQDPAPNPSLRAIEALVRLNTTPEFLDDRTQDASLRQNIDRQCGGQPVRQCIDYIEANRPAVLAALPNKPEYWQALEQLLAGPTLKFERGVPGAPGPRDDISKLIGAVSEWGYRAIAKDDRASTTKQFAINYRGIRNQMAESSGLVELSIFTALVEIAHSQVETLMALHTMEGDLDSIRRLMAKLTPYTKQETSMYKIAQGMAQEIITSLNETTYLTPASFLDSAIVPKGSLEEIRKWALEKSHDELARTQEYIREINERSWHDYWGEGFSGLATDSDPASDKPVLVPMSSYNEFIQQMRSSEVKTYPLLALGDIYLGHASPGIPAHATPAHWQWDWQEKASKVCLVPTHVAPGTTHFTVEHPACVTYQGSKGDHMAGREAG